MRLEVIGVSGDADAPGEIGDTTQIAIGARTARWKPLPAADADSQSAHRRA
jgi:hypothetical protein